MQPAPSLVCTLLAGALFALAPAAQSAAAKTPAAAVARPIADFHSPDGSRFVLLSDSTMQHVEWAIATPSNPAEDAPGLEGLGAAVARASLGGTWATGSVDPAKERAALERLDVAWNEVFATRGSAPAQNELRLAQEQVQALGDPKVFRRVLAALPVNQPELHISGGTTVLSLTTVPEALDDVAKLVLERREQQALRELPTIWTEEVMSRQRAFDADARVAVHAELIALALPGHPALRNFERPGLTTPRRSQALDAWAATQHPSRTVHVLIGNFDTTALRSLLEARFATTSLPTPPAPARPAIRKIANERRSTIPGCRENVVAIAWQLPAGPAVDNPWHLRALTRWLTGPDGKLPAALRAAQREVTSCRASAPWPSSPTIAGLLMVEVSANEIDGLADDLLRACRAASAGPSDAELAALAKDLQLAAAIVAADPRWLARDLAEQLLRWADQPILRTADERLSGEALRGLAKQVLGSRPVIVEGRR